MSNTALATVPERPRIEYRPRREWKYRLATTYTVKQNRIVSYRASIHSVRTCCGKSSPFIELEPDGTLTIHAGYCWDGPSGPSVDTLTFMRASLVHDALYQLMREEKLPQSCRLPADELMREMNLEDGMGSFRAWYTYHAVRLGGASSAKPDLVRAP